MVWRLLGKLWSCSSDWSETTYDRDGWRQTCFWNDADFLTRFLHRSLCFMRPSNGLWYVKINNPGHPKVQCLVFSKAQATPSNSPSIAACFLSAELQYCDPMLTGIQPLLQHQGESSLHEHCFCRRTYRKLSLLQSVTKAVGRPTRKSFTPSSTLSAIVCLPASNSLCSVSFQENSSLEESRSLKAPISLAKETCSNSPNQACTPEMFRGRGNSLMDWTWTMAGAGAKPSSDKWIPMNSSSFLPNTNLVGFWVIPFFPVNSRNCRTCQMCFPNFTKSHTRASSTCLTQTEVHQYPVVPHCLGIPAHLLPLRVGQVSEPAK